MVEKRGFCGETAFHVCFLMQTPTHLVLARRLLKHYPKLINDVYLSEEYYGEFGSNNAAIIVTNKNRSTCIKNCFPSGEFS